MNILCKSMTALVLLMATSFALACDYPPPPDAMPNGETASKEQMLAGVKMINEYQAKMGEYLSCIEADEVVAVQALDPDDKDAKEQRSKMFNKKYNAAVEEQTLAVEDFNSQIRAYKNRTN